MSERRTESACSADSVCSAVGTDRGCCSAHRLERSSSRPDWFSGFAAVKYRAPRYAASPPPKRSGRATRFRDEGAGGDEVEGVEQRLDASSAGRRAHSRLKHGSGYQRCRARQGQQHHLHHQFTRCVYVCVRVSVCVCVAYVSKYARASVCACARASGESPSLAVRGKSIAGSIATGNATASVAPTAKAREAKPPGASLSSASSRASSRLGDGVSKSRNDARRLSSATRFSRALALDAERLSGTTGTLCRFFYVCTSSLCCVRVVARFLRGLSRDDRPRATGDITHVYTARLHVSTFSARLAFRAARYRPISLVAIIRHFPSLRAYD